MDVVGFEGTKRLDDAALHALLEAGRPEQRVWAAWQIALRVGGAMPHIVAHVADEPSAGVRRALLVILAGHREYDVLVALGRHDPEIEVRAQAMQMVSGLAAEGVIPAVVVGEAYAAGPTQIRCAILRGMPCGPPHPLSPMVCDALAHGTDEEQLEAFDIAVRHGEPAHRQDAVRWLEHVAEPARFGAWARVQGVPSDEVVTMLRGASAALRVQALEHLTSHGIATLGELADDGATRAFQVIRQRPDFSRAPPELLARGILAGCALGFVSHLVDQLRAVDSPPPRLVGLLPALIDHAKTRIAELRKGRSLPDERTSYCCAYQAVTVEHYDRLLKQLTRLSSA